MTTILIRRGTTAAWASANTVLAAGEPGYDLDTRVLKIGDGLTAWSALTETADDDIVAELNALSDGKLDKTYLEGVPFTVYGNSLAVDTGADEYFDLAVAELDAGAVTSYAVGATRTNHTVASMLTSGTVPGLSAPAAGAVWPGVPARPGPVILDSVSNDIGHYPNNTVPTAITGAGGDRYLAAIKNQHQLALAIASSHARIEQTESATVVYAGTWVNKAGAISYSSGATIGQATAPGASVTFTVSAAQIAQKGPLAGQVWLVSYGYDPATIQNAAIDVSIDGGAATQWVNPGWETYGTNTGNFVAIPASLPVDGAAHTVKFTHVGASGHWMFADCLLLASENPAPIIIMGPPPVVVGSVFNASQVGTFYANRLKVEPKVKEAVALFPNAVYVSSTVTPEGLVADGVHLNARGQEQRGNDVIEAMRRHFGAWMRSHDSGDAALPSLWSPDAVPAATQAALTAARSAIVGEYTIAVIPDTQFLSQDYPAHFAALANYLAANKTALNLAAILHVGDVVDDALAGQYTAALPAMQTLRGIGVPFLAAIGNHDYETITTRTTTLWNSNFGSAFYASAAAVPVLKDAGKTENSYITTELGGRRTLIFALEVFPRDAVMTWANAVVASFPNHDIIVVTHGYMLGDGNRITWSSTYSPTTYSLTDANSGEDLWRDHFSHWRNLVGVFSGHHLTGNLAHRYDYGSGGSAVLQQFNNWQASTEGGQGRVVLLTINPVTGSARRRVYNAALGTFDTTAGYDRTLSWGRGSEAPGAHANSFARALYLTGAVGEYATTIDKAALRVADVEYVADITMPDWTPTSSKQIIGKWGTSTTTKHSILSLEATGALGFWYSFDGTTSSGSTLSTVAVPFADGERGRIRVKRVGASVTFYTARPGEPWTQLGTVKTIAATALFTGVSSDIMVGEMLYSGGSWQVTGQFHSAEMLNPTTRATLAEIRFDVPFSPRYRDDFGNAWTLVGSNYAWVRPSLVNV